VKTDHDRTRLPVWAQREIERLESNVRSLEQRLAAFGGETPTNTQVYAFEGPKINLPDDSMIRFHTGGLWDQHIDCRLKKEAAHLMLEVTSGGRLAVLPQVTNRLFVRVESR
jgi:hypothetical protein